VEKQSWERFICVRGVWKALLLKANQLGSGKDCLFRRDPLMSGLSELTFQLYAMSICRKAPIGKSHLLSSLRSQCVSNVRDGRTPDFSLKMDNSYRKVCWKLEERSSRVPQ